MIGQPRMRPHRQPRRQQHRHPNPPPQPPHPATDAPPHPDPAARIGARPTGPHPVTFALERVRRQVHPLGAAARRTRRPVDLVPAHDSSATAAITAPGLGPSLDAAPSTAVSSFGLRERGQHRVRTDLEQRRPPACSPVVRQQGVVRSAPGGGPGAPSSPAVAQSSSSTGRPVTVLSRRKRRLPVGDARRDLGELGQHRLHQRRVERVARPAAATPGGPAPAQPAITRSTASSSPETTTDVGPLTAAIATGSPPGKAVQDLDNLGFGGLDRRHRAAAGQRLHQPAAAATSRAASARSKTPAAWAAASSPIEWPGTKSGRTPQDSQQPTAPPRTANSAGLGVARLVEQPRLVGARRPRTAPRRSGPGTRRRRPVRRRGAQTSSRASANTGKPSYSSRPMPSRWRPAR